MSRFVVGDEQLIETTQRALLSTYTREEQRLAETAGWSAAVWSVLEKIGVPWIGSKADGSMGTDIDAAEVLFLCGASAAPVPVLTGFIGGWLLDSVGLDADSRIVTSGLPSADAPPRLVPTGDGYLLPGVIDNVPWVRHADVLAIVASSTRENESVVLVKPEQFEVVQERKNLANEPRATVRVTSEIAADQVHAAPNRCYQRLCQREALGRVVLACGAMQYCSDLVTSYAKTRQQFGREIGAFQAVQHHVVRVAQQTAIATAASRTAVAELASDGTQVADLCAIASVVATNATEIVARASHQVFGAIGLTLEHDLNFRTKRMLSLASEWGSVAPWDVLLGQRYITTAEDFWPSITATSLSTDCS